MRIFGYPYSLIRFLTKVDGATTFRGDALCKRRGFDCAREYQKIKLTCFFKKKYKKQIAALREEIERSFSSLPHENCGAVWVCWLQGMESAPEIVRICLNSLKKHLGGEREIRVIDKFNYKKYVTLPDYIEEKYRKGIITDALFSDELRLALLTEHGGTWIDATILCTAEPPEYMFSGLFMPRTSMWETYQIAFRTESYFITASSHDKILSMARSLFERYWREYDISVEYLLVYVFIEIAIEQFPEEWAKVYPFPRADMNLLQEWYENEFDGDIFNEIVGRSPFHKLTYKVTQSCESDGNNFYNYILSHYDK